MDAAARHSLSARRGGRLGRDYAAMLADAGCAVDTWETTYVHELTGENPVLGWITGTALTPVKSAPQRGGLAAIPQRADPDAQRTVSGAAGRADVLSVPPDLRRRAGGLGARPEPPRRSRFASMPTTPFALSGVTVVTGDQDGTSLADQTVVVDASGKIEAIGAASDVVAPHGYRRIDATGGSTSCPA